MRRLREIRLHFDSLAGLLVGQETATIGDMGLPADAKLVGTYLNHDRRQVCLQLEHESFEPVLPGHPIRLHGVI